jgi:glycolate oxidase
VQNLDRTLVDVARALPDGSVITDPDVLQRYAKDEGEVEPRLPGAVVRVSSTEEVRAVLHAASRHRVPVTPRAGGTSRVGSATPVAGGIVITVEKMLQIKEIDRTNLIAVVEPGVITGALHGAVEAEGLFYPPDPNSLDSCALGGNVGTNAAGPRAFKYGVTREYVLGLEVVTGDGTVLRLGRRTPKGVVGYDLTALVVGSEGTLAVVTEVTVKLLPKPESVATLLAFLRDEAAIERAVTEMTGRRLRPRCVELMDGATLDIIRPQTALAVPAGARAMLLVEVDGEAAHVDGDLERCGNALADAGAIDVLVATRSSERERLWAARKEMSHSLRKLAAHKLSEDVVVPRTQIAALLRQCREASERAGIAMPTYGHAGDGNLHVNFLWDREEQWPVVKRAIGELFRSVVDVGGTVSGEHGIGILKAPYLPLAQPEPLIRLQRHIKSLFDPHNILNPDKIFPAPHGPC